MKRSSIEEAHHRHVQPSASVAENTGKHSSNSQASGEASSPLRTGIHKSVELAIRQAILEAEVLMRLEMLVRALRDASGARGWVREHPLTY